MLTSSLVRARNPTFVQPLAKAVGDALHDDPLVPSLDFQFAKDYSLYTRGDNELALTYTRVGNATRFNSLGVLETIPVNVPVFDWDPATLQPRGFSIWEARTNSLRVNDMTGAVAGVARTNGSITLVSRAASTTVVVASTGHTVAVNDMITAAGWSVGAYNGTYAVSAVVANVSYSYVVASSASDTATGGTFVVMSPGTVPTNWTINGVLADGVASTVVGTGVDHGINYIDVRWAGLTGAGTGVFLAFFESNTQIVTSETNTWTGSAYIALVGGSFTNAGAGMGLRLAYCTAAGAAVTQQDVVITGVTSTLAANRITNTFLATGATIARVNLDITTNFVNASMVDFTLRIGMPQLELGT